MPCILFHRYLLDNVITLERLTYLGRFNKLKYVLNYKPHLLIIVLLILSFLISSPVFFHLEARNDIDFKNLLVNLNNYKSIEYCFRKEFFDSLIGKILLLFIFILRDVVTLLSEIYFSYKSLKFYQLFLHKKSMINLQKLSKNTVYTKKSNKNSIDNTKIIKHDNLTKMTFVLSFNSIICHSLSLICNFFLLFYKHQTSLFFTCVFVILMKNSSNIFFFYFFNKNFKRSIKNTFFNKNSE
jgi:hypothetical protein